MSKITITQNGNGRDIVTIEDAKVITEFNNFSGEHGYMEGDNRRTMFVAIDDENAIKYFEDNGWNVKTRFKSIEDPNDPMKRVLTDEVEFRYLKINVSYRFYNPNDKNPVPTILEKDPGSGNVMAHTEDTVGSIDTFRRRDGFEHCDLIFKGTPYEMNGGGISAYLQWMQFTPHYNMLEDTIERLTYGSEDNGDIPF